ncbi:MAG: GNAT family N-acetyltransferase [Alphaproteobacteria bacterium]|nr:GNAT family N-acetyltransferase [Alphaproteobacteria bacterium]
MFEVRIYTPADRAAWDEFVTKSKNGTFLLLRSYMDYHAHRFVESSLIVSDASGSIVAVLPANRVEARLESHGGLSYGGLVLNERVGTAEVLDLFEAVLAFSCRHGIEEILYKSVPRIYHRLPADEDQYALFYYGARLFRREALSVVDLSSELGMQERRRRGMRKALKAGLKVASSDDIAAFWPILEANLRSRHGLRPVHTVSEMQLLRSLFPENIKLYGVFDGEAMCAGTLLYLTPETAHVQYTGSREEGRDNGALDLLYGTIIPDFKGKFRYFDFGNSNEDEGKYLNRGLVQFKEGFGARTISHDFYKLPVKTASR